MKSGAIRRFGASVAIASLMVILALCGLLIPRSAGAQAWFDTNWQYRRAVSVANPGSTPLTDYQVRITLDGSFNFLRARSDGTDLRVTASDGTTPLPYWTETWNPAGSQALIWVRVPSIPVGGTTVYVYYGDPFAGPASNGSTTFALFDDSLWTGSPVSNPIQTAGQSWWEANLTFPTVFEDTSIPGRPRYHMLYDGHNLIGHAKGYATSSDLVHWAEFDNGLSGPARINPIMGPGYTGDAPFAWGDVIKRDGIYHMFPSRGPGQTVHTQSSDLLHWTGFEALSPGSISTGAAILKLPDGITPVIVNGRYWMVYFAADSPGSMYMASTDATGDLLTWTTCCGGGPFLTPTAGSWDSGGMWTPSFVKVGDTYYIYYEALGSTWTIGYAKGAAVSGGNPVQPDNVTWTKPASTSITPTHGWDAGGCTDPVLRQFNGTYYLFYTSNGAYTNGLCTSTSPEGPWTQYGGVSGGVSWAKGGAPTVTNGILNLGSGSSITSPASYSPGTALGFSARYYNDPSTNAWAGFMTGTSFPGLLLGANSYSPGPYGLYLAAYSGSFVTASVGSPPGAFHVYENAWVSPSLGRVFVDNSTVPTGSIANAAAVPDGPLPVEFYNYNNGAHPLSVDWMYVRKYAEPEPTGTVGSEQLVTYTLTTNAAPSAGGSVSASPPGGTYNSGTVVQLTAMPAAGYQFVNWSGGATGTSNPVNVTMTGDLSVTANFAVLAAANTVSAGPPSACITTAHPCATVPVRIARTDATPMLAFSVDFALSPNLALCTPGPAITEGTYLGAGGRPTSFQIIAHGNGTYTADGAVLGPENCGPTDPSGTLFDVALTHGAGSGTGTVTVTGIRLRNCANVSLASTIGGAGSVSIDLAPVAVAALATPQTVQELSALTITPSVTLSSCATGPATWSVSPALPSGAALDPSSGVITWTPACGTTGSHGPFTLTATAASGDAGSSNAFVIDVLHNAGAVTVAVGSSFTIEETSALSMPAPTATLTACAAGPVTWSVAPALPAGATLGADGVVAWTPACGQAGDYGPFTLTALAATGETGTAAFGITVTHRAGTVTVAAIADPTVAELSPLTVAPGATLTACAGGALTWTATDLPPGAGIDGATGVVTWTPSCAAFETNGGVYGPMTVTAHAGTGETGATTFTIHVTDTPVAVAQVTGLVATTGPAPGGGVGRTGITLHFTAPPEATSIEVYRAAFGNYPEYDDPPNAGTEPAVPGYPPSGPWTLTGVTASGQADNPPSRDFWYYVAFARNACGDVSLVSERTAGALDYRLGDVSNGAAVGTGDNLVGTGDITALGAHYGLSGAAVEAYDYLDVGPTTTGWVDGRPVTDDEIGFEDLVLFAINYGQVSFLWAGAKPDGARTAGAEEIALARPDRVSAGTTAVAELRVRGSGALSAVSATLSWDPAVVEPVGQAAGEWLTRQGGIALSPRPGTVDAAVLGGAGMAGEGLLSTVTFRAIAAGDPQIRIRALDGRDAANRKVAVNSIEEPLALALPTVTELSAVTPNPFRAGTTIALSLARGGPVDLAIYTVSGRRVTTLVRETRDPGVYQLAWNGCDAAGRAMGAGVYYVHLAAPGGQFTRAITRLR